MHLHGYCLNSIKPSNFLIIKRTIPYKSKDKRELTTFKELHVKLISLNKAVRLQRKNMDKDNT